MNTHITLTSDASLDIFPNNKIGSFRTKLPQNLYLDKKKHVVGLKYFSWPHTIKNLTDGRIKIRVLERLEDGVNMETQSLRVPEGYYRDIDSLVKAINSTIKQMRFVKTRFEDINFDEGFFRFEFDQPTDTVSLISEGDHTPRELRINLSSELQLKLGFTLRRNSTQWLTPPAIARHSSDINIEMSNLFIYCSLIQPTRIIGNVMTNLIAIAPMIGSHGSVVHFEPKLIEYYEINRDSVSEIQIEIYSDTGRPVEFMAGKCFVTLNIKEK